MQEKMTWPFPTQLPTREPVRVPINQENYEDALL
jgi:hypothetical protein